MEQSDWCMHNSVPDDTPPASPASMPLPLWGSTYFLTPTVAEALWPFLTLGERASLQAAEWWAHADLRWYIRGMAAFVTPPAVHLNRRPFAPAAPGAPGDACLAHSPRTRAGKRR